MRRWGEDWRGLYAARGCFVRVKFVDYRRVSCRDGAALEFHGRGEFAGLLSPFFGNQLEAFEGLEVGEATVDIANDLGIKSEDAAVGDEIGAATLVDTVLRGPGIESDEVGGDEYTDELVLVTDQGGIGDEDIVFELVFNRLRGDEFAAGGLEQLFFAVGDIEEAIGV